MSIWYSFCDVLPLQMLQWDFMKNALLALLLIASTLLLSACGSGSAQSATNAEGSLGNGVEFTFNATSGKLTISGAGQIKNFEKPEDAPWYSYRASIEKIEIGENITAIGNYAFYHFTAL